MFDESAREGGQGDCAALKGLVQLVEKIGPVCDGKPDKMGLGALGTKVVVGARGRACGIGDLVTL